MASIDYFKPLDSLRNLAGSGFKQPSPTRPTLTGMTADTPYELEDEGLPVPEDPNYQLLDLQKQRREELVRNASKGLSMAAPQANLNQLNSDISSNPITKQGIEVEDYLGKLKGANQEGFSTPQEQSVYGRNLEAEKMRQPLEVAKTTGQYNFREQELRNKGAVDVAKVTQSGKDAELAAIKSILANGGGNGRSFSAGGVRVGPEPTGGRVPSALLTQVNKAREKVNKQNAVGRFFNGGSVDKDLEGAIATALSQHHASAQIKSFAQEVAGNPTTSKIPFDQLIQDPSIDLSDATPSEIDDLRDLLGIIRGF